MRSKAIKFIIIISIVVAQSSVEPSLDKGGSDKPSESQKKKTMGEVLKGKNCLLYTSPSPRDS